LLWGVDTWLAGQGAKTGLDLYRKFGWTAR